MMESRDSIMSEIQDKKVRLMGYKMQVRSGQEDKFHKIKEFKREIARLLTRLHKLDNNI